MLFLVWCHLRLDRLELLIHRYQQLHPVLVLHLFNLLSGDPTQDLEDTGDILGQFKLTKSDTHGDLCSELRPPLFVLPSVAQDLTGFGVVFVSDEFRALG